MKLVVVLQSVVVALVVVAAVVMMVAAADDAFAAALVDHTCPSAVDAAAVAAEDVAFVVAPSFDPHSWDWVVPVVDSVACSNVQTTADVVAVIPASEVPWVRAEPLLDGRPTDNP